MCFSAGWSFKLATEAASDEGVGREGIEPSRVAPGDFKSPASTVSPPPPAGSCAVRGMILTCRGLFVNRYYPLWDDIDKLHL